MNASSTDGAYRARGARPLTQGYVEDEADTAIFAGHAAASNQAVGIRKLEAVAGRHAEHRSAEKHPGIKLVLGQPEGDVVDGLQPGAGVSTCASGTEIKVDGERSVRTQLARNEVDHAAIRRPNRRNLELTRPERAVYSRTLQRGRSIQRPYRVIGKQSCGADRRATLVEARARSRVGLGVEDQIDIPLTMKRHLFRTVLSRIVEAETFDELAQSAPGVLVHGK